MGEEVNYFVSLHFEGQTVNEGLNLLIPKDYHKSLVESDKITIQIIKKESHEKNVLEKSLESRVLS